MRCCSHAFMQNLRRGHYELATDVSPPFRLATASSELARAMWPGFLQSRRLPRHAERNRPLRPRRRVLQASCGTLDGRRRHRNLVTTGHADVDQGDRPPDGRRPALSTLSATVPAPRSSHVLTMQCLATERALLSSRHPSVTSHIDTRRLMPNLRLLSPSRAESISGTA